jgi:hypothetical protein
MKAGARRRLDYAGEKAEVGNFCGIRPRNSTESAPKNSE